MSRKSSTSPAGPSWFDPALHFIGTFGIHDRATGALLDAQGQPASPATRAALAKVRPISVAPAAANLAASAAGEPKE